MDQLILILVRLGDLHDPVDVVGIVVAGEAVNAAGTGRMIFGDGHELDSDQPQAAAGLRTGEGSAALMRR